MKLAHRGQTLARRALRRKGSRVCNAWGRGTGKTHFNRLEWYEEIAEWDGVARDDALTPFTGVRVVHLMPTFKQCKDVYADLTWGDLMSGGQWDWLGAQINRTTWHITFPGGSWIKWFGTREANASRGLRCDIVSLDEADDIDPDVLDAIVKPWFSEPWSFRKLLLSGTPRRGRYGLLYREFLAGQLEERKVALGQLAPERRRAYSFHVTYRDAPSIVSAEYVDEVRENTPPATFAREWECDFDANEGLVYAMFDEAFHVRKPPEGVVWTEMLVGVDHGWEDPGVFLFLGVMGSGKDAVVWVLDEVYEQHKVETWWCERATYFAASYPKARWYADPSMPARNKALGGAGAKMAEDVNNDIHDGIAAVADRLFIRTRDDDDDRDKVERYARLYVDPRCENTIREFKSYRRKRDADNPDHILEDPEDRNNHAMDALRYPILTHFVRSRAAKWERHHEDRQ